MDQDAFRALLNKPADPASSLNRANPSSRANGKLALGSGSTSRATNRSNTSGSTYNPSSSLKPRKFKAKEASDGSGTSRNGDRFSRGGYRDRASERRQGLDGDFAEAEHLLENFQARVAAAGSQVDKEILEQQTKYLGGDEHHTILVKGLDHALLERRKAELSECGKLGQVTDDDLEAAYAHNAKQSLPGPSHTSSASSKSNQKKNRDELLEQLKISRNQQPADLVVVEKLKAAGKFKPIGFTSVDDKKQEEERKERKRRKAEKKKKKALKAEQASTTPTTNSNTLLKNNTPVRDSNIVGSSAKNEQLEHHEVGNSFSKIHDDQPSKTNVSTNSTEYRQTENAPKQSAPADDPDMDIFGDAGEYKGLDEDSSGEEDTDRKAGGPVTCTTALGLPKLASKKRKNYFEDDEVQADTNSEKETKEKALINSNKPVQSGRIKQSIEEPDSGMNDDERNHGFSHESPRLTKLEGLSGSADIKAILAVDAFQEKEEKRKAKKLKNKSDPNHEKVLSEKDRLNRDYLEMQKFLNQKKSKEGDHSTGVP